VFADGTGSDVGAILCPDNLELCTDKRPSTAACCTVRTALSGALMDKDITCRCHWSLSSSACANPRSNAGAITTNVGWRL